MARRRKKRRALSRRKRAVLVGICLIGTALLVWLDQGTVPPQWLDFLTPRERTFTTDLAQYHGRRFAVVRVVDGDTLHLAVPDPPEEVTKVRLVGIDAPEMGTRAGERMYFAQEATAFAERLALNHEVSIYLDERAGSRDRYERLLAYVELPDGRFLNEELLAEGYAYAERRFRHSYSQKYQQLEASARALKAGLWKGVKPEQMPLWRQRVGRAVHTLHLLTPLLCWRGPLLDGDLIRAQS